MSKMGFAIAIECVIVVQETVAFAQSPVSLHPMMGQEPNEMATEHF